MTSHGDGFTFSAYEELLDVCQSAGYTFLTVRDYLESTPLPERFVVMRHDVDRKPENALAMARLEADHEVASTYYVRTIPKTFDPTLLQDLESLGHEVGYHYEDLDRADGDPDQAQVSFAAELARVRSLVSVDTVCMHGNPLTSYDNRDLWGENPQEWFDWYDLLGEAYLSMDFVDVTYFSDTGRTWRDGALKIKDHTVGPDGKSQQVETTAELVDLLESGTVDRVCLLTHPNRWARTYPELLAESTKDAVINAGKQAMQLLGHR